MKKTIFKWLARLLKIGYTIEVQHLYWPRKDRINLINLITANPVEQQVFPIVLPDGTKSWGQLGHYFKKSA